MTFLKKILQWLRAQLNRDPPVYYIGGSDTLPPPLTKEEERTLLESIDREESRRKLIEHNLRLVVYIARRFENTGIHIEDRNKRLSREYHLLLHRTHTYNE